LWKIYNTSPDDTSSHPNFRRKLNSNELAAEAKSGSVTNSEAFLRERHILYDLIKNYVDCLPRYWVSGVPATRVVEMIARYMLHSDESVRKAAMQAVLRISTIIQGIDLIFSFRFGCNLFN
jgi:hypothetical protein